MTEPAPDSEETRVLLRQAGAGDSTAFERLFTRYRAELLRVVELRLDGRLRPRFDPSDVVQETQLEAFRRLDDFLTRRPMPFRLWLRRTAYERLLKIHRAHEDAGRRAVGREVSLPDHSSLLLAQQLAAPGSTPSQHLSREERSRRVREAVAQLPDADREVLLMRHFEGLSNQEVSCLLDITPAAASQRHGRALLRLRKLLLDSGLAESQ
jgi:RNA polymerase sigma-70 factor (ECF subfamily)